jgi:hypothetical protein
MEVTKMGKREFKIYCEEVGNDGSEFKLVFEVNGKVENEEVWYSMDDILLSVGEFYGKCLSEWEYDSRCDSLDVSINYRMWW